MKIQRNFESEMINPVSLEILYIGIIGLGLGIVGLIYSLRKQSKLEVK
jgi:hypothetical protein